MHIEAQRKNYCWIPLPFTMNEKLKDQLEINMN